MYTLKGFYSYPSLVSNTPGTVAAFGELSTNSLTFAKDKQLFTDTVNAPQTALVSFHSVKDNLAVIVPAGIASNALKIGDYLLTMAKNSQIPNDRQLLVQQLTAEFSAWITSVVVGDIQVADGLTLPTWISYTDITGADVTTVTVWLSDASFSALYDEYDIVVVPPLKSLDGFFNDPIQVKAALQAYTLTQKLQDVQTVRGEYPYTLQQVYSYNYTNPLLTTDTTLTDWIVLTYGPAGNNPDIIRQAIVDYVLANSTHTQDQWKTVLPDLFTNTEFIITPFWTQYSVPNEQYQAGIYSPVLTPSVAQSLTSKTALGSGYTQAWAISQYQLSATIYKSLGFAILGNPENRNGQVHFTDVFPDYMIVTNTSADSNRMSAQTLEWVNLFLQLVVAAESMTAYTEVPAGLSRVVRDGVIYASAFYNNINYLVVTKGSLEAL